VYVGVVAQPPQLAAQFVRTYGSTHWPADAYDGHSAKLSVQDDKGGAVDTAFKSPDAHVTLQAVFSAPVLLAQPTRQAAHAGEVAIIVITAAVASAAAATDMTCVMVHAAALDVGGPAVLRQHGPASSRGTLLQVTPSKFGYPWAHAGSHSCQGGHTGSTTASGGDTTASGGDTTHSVKHANGSGDPTVKHLIIQSPQAGFDPIRSWANFAVSPAPEPRASIVAASQPLVTAAETGSGSGKEFTGIG
jgi:hypothetical protein